MISIQQTPQYDHLNLIIQFPDLKYKHAVKRSKHTLHAIIPAGVKTVRPAALLWVTELTARVFFMLAYQSTRTLALRFKPEHF
jgi:hypothetical protein